MFFFLKPSLIVYISKTMTILIYILIYFMHVIDYNLMLIKCQHGTDPWATNTVYCLLSTFFCIKCEVFCLLVTLQCLLYCYLYYFITLLQLQTPADMFALVCSVRCSVQLNDHHLGWRHDHGPNNVGAIVKA